MILPWDATTELLLLVVQGKESVRWAEDQDRFPCVIARKPSEDPICGVPFNIGAESSSFLRFIVNHYDRLPRNLCLLHGHERSWHQPFAVLEKITWLLRTGKHGSFSPLNGIVVDTGDPARGWVYELFRQVWDAVVRPHLDLECPRRIVTDGSGQFIVSREAIRANPRALYQDLYDYTTGSRRWPGDEAWRDGAGYSFAPGGQGWEGCTYFLEWIWHLLFQQNPVLSTWHILTGNGELLDPTALPAVSCVYVPTGSPRRFHRALSGFLGQSYPRKELLVVADRWFGDGPPDSLAGQGVRFIAAEASGFGCRFNQGVRASSGDCLARWHDCEYSTPQRLAQQIHAMASHRSRACVVPRVTRYDHATGAAQISPWFPWESTLCAVRELFPALADRVAEEEPVLARTLLKHYAACPRPELIIREYLGQDPFEADPGFSEVSGLFQPDEANRCRPLDPHQTGLIARLLTPP